MQTIPQTGSAHGSGSNALPSRDRAAFVLVGGFIFAAAAAVLIGWLIHNTLLTRIHASFVPMPVNAAAALVGAGSAFLFAGLERTRMSAVLGAASCAFGALASYPGVWVNGTHLAFWTVAAGFTALALPEGKTRQQLLGWSGSLTAAVAVAALAGYLWGGQRFAVGIMQAPMPFAAAVIFLTSGAAFVQAGWKRTNPNLPIVLVMCLGMLIAFHIHLALDYADRRIGQKNFEYDAHDRIRAVEKELQLHPHLELSVMLDRALGGLAPSPSDFYLFEKTDPETVLVVGYFGSRRRPEPEQPLNAEEIRNYPYFVYREPVRAGRPALEAVCLYLPQWDVNRKRWLPWAASSAVAGFTTLLAYFLWVLIHRSRIISDTVQQRTSQLEKANQTLEEEVRQRRIAEAKFEEQRRYLEKANSELDGFVYTASHDLRAPLRAIASFAAFLQEDCGPKLDAQGQDHLEEIRKGALRMNRLIDDLLTLSRISRVRNPFEPAPVGDIVRDVLDRSRFDIESAGARVNVAADLPVILCDRVKLTEVFLNLVLNAVKFSAKRDNAAGRVPTWPRIEIGWADRGDRWEFFVKDNGIGIDPKYHDQIFGIFKRLHANDAYEGTGVGLSIVKRVVEDHGGRVRVESQAGQGATFRVFLPKTPGTQLK